MTLTPDAPQYCQLWLGILKIDSTNKFAGSRATFHPQEAESSKLASQRIAQRGDTGPTACDTEILVPVKVLKGQGQESHTLILGEGQMCAAL